MLDLLPSQNLEASLCSLFFNGDGVWTFNSTCTFFTWFRKSLLYTVGPIIANSF